MDHGHDHGYWCGGICHLNANAQTLYFSLLEQGRQVDAAALRERGVFPR